MCTLPHSPAADHDKAPILAQLQAIAGERGTAPGAGGGVLVNDGPYFESSGPAPEGNLALDQSLRARDPAWGIRRVEDVVQVAGDRGLVLGRRIAMPANNLMLAFWHG